MKRMMPWLGFAGILFIIFGTIYLVTQQAQRTDANWPQIQMAEDTAAALNQGANPSALVTGRVDMNTSLAPFIIVYDKSGRVVAGSGYLDGMTPEAPFGILKAAQGNEYHSISWQPEGTIRIAAVTVAANNYYVLSGRSLKQVELNENQTFWFAFSGGVASLVALGVTYALCKPHQKRNR